jgi:DNA-binding transcriptional regulator GbsR (MarR family)
VNDLHEKLKKARECIVEHIGKNHQMYGVNPSVGRLLGTMYYYDEPMTLDDMKTELEMSKASMSLGVRELIDLELVEKIWVKGDRKDYFKVQEDNYDSFIKIFSYKWRKGNNNNRGHVRDSIIELLELREDEEIDMETKELIDKDLEKLYLAIEYIDWLDRVIDLFESHEIFKHVPKRKITEENFQN